MKKRTRCAEKKKKKKVSPGKGTKQTQGNNVLAAWERDRGGDLKGEYQKELELVFECFVIKDGAEA